MLDSAALRCIAGPWRATLTQNRTRHCLGSWLLVELELHHRVVVVVGLWETPHQSEGGLEIIYIRMSWAAA